MVVYTCPVCGNEFPFVDSRLMVPGAQCYECDYEDALREHRLVSAAVKHAGFVESMRGVDTATLQRWAANEKLTQHRREVAAQVLRERGL